MHTLLLWGSIVICLAIVFSLQFRAFGTAEKERSPESIVSFFHTHEFAEKWQRNLIAIATSVPLCFIFVIVAEKSTKAGKTFVRDVLDTGPIDSELKNFLVTLLEFTPDYAFPFLVLLVSFLVFGAQLKFLYRYIEKGVVYSAGLSSKANNLIAEFSSILLDGTDYSIILETLERPRPNKLPLPEELEGVSNQSKLSFQLVHLAKRDTKTIGLRKALIAIAENRLTEIIDDKKRRKLEKKIYPEHDGSTLTSVQIGLFYIFASIVIFLIVCGLYIGIVPSLFKLFDGSNIVWPSYEEIDSLIDSLSLVVLATIVPMLFGILFLQRSSNGSGKTEVRKHFVLFSAVFLLSLFVNFFHAAMTRILAMVGYLDSDKETRDVFIEFPEAFFIFSHSLIPSAAVLAVASVSKGKLLRQASIATAIAVVTVGHLLCYAVFELIAEKNWNFFWHQGLLGFVLSAASLILLLLFWRPSQAKVRTLST